jgi:hypothetical protein
MQRFNEVKAAREEVVEKAKNGWHEGCKDGWK